MGGASSKFNATDWIRADGKLENLDETIDGYPPTSAYGVYYLNKRGMNQREFDVVDLEQNLLYTTRVVPGTLAWFDVLGRGMEEHLLRVQVDLSRRYWIIYRFGIPAFAGQLADIEATEKLASNRKAAHPSLSATPFLFRKCCITVSWSRYMAVAMQYGPPDAEALSMHGETEDADDGEDSDFFAAASNIAKNMRNRAPTETSEDLNKAVEDGSTPSEAAEGEQLQQDFRPNYFYYSEKEKTDNDDQGEASTPYRRGKHWRKFMNETKKMLSTSSRMANKPDVLEGMISLDRRIVLCQEIYDKIIGNHQTSVISKAKAIKLLKEDIDQHNKDGGADDDDAFLLDQEAILEQVRTPKATKKSAPFADEPENPEKHNSDSVESKADTLEDKVVDENHTEARLGPLHADEKPPPGYQLQELSRDSEVEENISEEATEDTTEENKGEEPLIGYWAWENTLRSHKIKMHVAKNSDLALHVVIAIIVNQVRYERNAIAMTV